MKKTFNLYKANKIHNNTYDYSLVEYKNVDTKVKIICQIHGIFNQTPYHHINRKQGCGKCKGNKISRTKRMKLNEFIIKANKIHNNTYDYSLVEYINSHTKILIICPIHGVFNQTPNNHIYIKNGCPSCGYNVSKTATKWLDDLKIPKEYRETTIKLNDQIYKVDAFNPKTKTIYEYFGYFWHGHPDYYNPNDINPRNNIKYGDLFELTNKRIMSMNKSEYNFIYTWGK